MIYYNIKITSQGAFNPLLLAAGRSHVCADVCKEEPQEKHRGNTGATGSFNDNRMHKGLQRPIPECPHIIYSYTIRIDVVYVRCHANVFPTHNANFLPTTIPHIYAVHVWLKGWRVLNYSRGIGRSLLVRNRVRSDCRSMMIFTTGYWRVCGNFVDVVARKWFGGGARGADCPPLPHLLLLWGV